MADSGAVRSRRHRQHRLGDHRLCRERCHGPRLAVVADGPPPPDEDLERVIRAGLGTSDPAVLSAALSLGRKSAGSGYEATQALKALVDLVLRCPNQDQPLRAGTHKSAR